MAGLKDQVHSSAALKAASKVGNTLFIEYLIQVGGKISSKDLGYALTIATRNRQGEAADIVIDAGADVSIHGDRPPLLEVLKQRNAGLVAFTSRLRRRFQLWSG